MDAAEGAGLTDFDDVEGEGEAKRWLNRESRAEAAEALKARHTRS